MSLLDYNGKIVPAVKLTFRGDHVPGAKSSTPVLGADNSLVAKDYPYVVANESVYEFTITGKVDGKQYRMTRKASRGKRYFSSKKNCYIMAPVDGQSLKVLLDSGSKATWKLDMKIKYKPFFYEVLTRMTSIESSLSNLAYPVSQELLDTITYRRKHKKTMVKYKTADEVINNIPLKLIDTYISADSGKAPVVEFLFELDFLTSIDEPKREAMRKLMAMDWTKLLKYAKKEQESHELKPYSRIWWENIYYYIVNHSDLNRGAKIAMKMVKAHNRKSEAALARPLRDDIDHWLITANHWGQRREDWTTERYHSLLSDAFGPIQTKHWLASPVSFQRKMQSRLKLKLAAWNSLTLLQGVGHCGEHAYVAYGLLSALIDDPLSPVKHVVVTGNSNVDHAFVLYGIEVDEAFETIVQNKRNTLKKIGDDIKVWNLKGAMEWNPESVGYVLDAYLAPSEIAQTATDLLKSMNSKRRIRKRKDTDFLSFYYAYPDKVIWTKLDEAKNV